MEKGRRGRGKDGGRKDDERMREKDNDKREGNNSILLTTFQAVTYLNRTMEGVRQCGQKVSSSLNQSTKLDPSLTFTNVLGAILGQRFIQLLSADIEKCEMGSRAWGLGMMLRLLCANAGDPRIRVAVMRGVAGAFGFFASFVYSCI